MDAGCRPGTDSCLGHRGTRGEVESRSGALPRLDPDWVTGVAQMGADTAADDNRRRLSHASVEVTRYAAVPHRRPTDSVRGARHVLPS